MVDRRALPAAGLAQLLGVLALVAGVVAMHSAVFGFSGHAHAAGMHTLAPASDAVADGLERAAAAPGFPHRQATPRTPDSAPAGHDRLPPQDRAHHDSSAPRAVEAASGASWHATVAAKMSHCAGGGCDSEHSALHGCVFILAASIALAALVLLRRLAFDRPSGGAARPRHWRARRARPPPWTVLTLAELAILRI
ncbi:hypothetical protein [Nocardia sp. NPDC004260]